MTAVRAGRSETDEQIAQLLRTARASLGLGLAFLSRLDGTTQHMEVIESSFPWVFKDGNTQPQEGSFCQAILDGRLPAVIPDVMALPEAKRLPAARFPLRLRSYVSVPVTLSDGRVWGTFCAAGFRRDRDLARRDQALMEVLARAAAVIIEPTVVKDERQSEILRRMRPVLEDGGPSVVLQPIVDLQTGARTGAEALSRFPAGWGLAPDVCFGQAHEVGLGDQLELLALHRAGGLLQQVPGYLGMNISPATLLTEAAELVLSALPLDRVLLELSEHDQVADYPTLMQVLQPFRAAGMRLAIDDVGAGFSSLRHIVMTAPDVLKIDRSLVAGVGQDDVLQVLVRSMVDFAAGLGSTVVAEGIETEQDAQVLRDLGVHHGQGWLFGRPGPVEQLDAGRALGSAADSRPAVVP